jgi:hypothetical protein
VRERERERERVIQHSTVQFSNSSMSDFRARLEKDPKKHTELALDYLPSDQDVICGRGAKVWAHKGNEVFRSLVKDRLDQYKETPAKLEKSYILCEIVDHIRTVNGGDFVKFNTRQKRWYEVGDYLAKEKTSQAFRDALSEHYKSSSTAKRMRRQQEEDNCNNESNPLPLQLQLLSSSRTSNGNRNRNSNRNGFPPTEISVHDETGSSSQSQSSSSSSPGAVAATAVDCSLDSLLVELFHQEEDCCDEEESSTSFLKKGMVCSTTQ